MNQVYNQLATPYKQGAVLKFEDKLCDSPSVFQLNGKWYMTYITIDKDVSSSGYSSYIAESDDLLNWHPITCILDRKEDNFWDSKQVAAYAAFVNNDFDGDFSIKPLNGKYYFSYLGGNLNGYETDPLMMGLAYTDNIVDAQSYHRLPNPILRPDDKDAREGENLTLYKSQLFVDEAETLGYRFVNAYNAKGSKESIFLAVSNDGVNWKRYGNSPIIWDDSKEKNIQINGDPMILKMNDMYVMVYFILKNGKAYNTFAVSKDLIHWTKWQGKPLIESQYEWENMYAHKSSVVVKDGVVFHYYCAVNSLGERFIALATSKELV